MTDLLPPLPPLSPLSPTQRSMLDLALQCDLLLTPPHAHDALRTRHHAIVSAEGADAYIRELEQRIHQARCRHPRPRAL